MSTTTPRLPTMAELDEARQQLAWLTPEQLIECVYAARMHITAADEFLTALKTQMHEHMAGRSTEDIEVMAEAIVLLARYGA